jgi:hypothetical protein
MGFDILEQKIYLCREKAIEIFHQKSPFTTIYVKENIPHHDTRPEPTATEKWIPPDTHLSPYFQPIWNRPGSTICEESDTGTALHRDGLCFYFSHCKASA